MKRNKIQFFLVVIFFATVHSSCSKKKGINTVAEYISVVQNPENGLSTSKKIEDFEFSVLYKPLDYIIALENKDNKVSKDSINKRKQQLEGYQYYTFRLKSSKDNEFFRTGMNSENEYYERLEYFVTNAQDDIYLIDGTDTLTCELYHFERNYGISPYSNIVLAFKQKNETEVKGKTFIYDDKILGVGKIALKINAKDIIDLPKLEI
ncbi:MAG: hypothetical protein A3F72_01875 [Bacteroidetes bacterium RIFCSPLOWO2_12_FULL_35_15]|nr:MAG: hypothetical protein A3F72_01875 [Bacteroidetes bacterium RIFCSPLOWO2_12_FULL_35_15]